MAYVLGDQAAVLDAEAGAAELRLGSDPVARHVEVTVSPLGNRIDDRAGQLLLLRDISERKEVEERLRWLANYDPLTRLPNRRLFGDRLAQTMIASRRHQARGALILIDLDGFKLINDSLGHQVGDELLVAVADRLRQQRREEDTAARLGGDEFAVLLPEIGHAEDAAVVATKILAAVAQPVRIRGHLLNVTVSIGVAVWPDDGVDQHLLLSSADAALYQAKARGKNRFELATPELGELAARRLRLATELRHALDGGELRLLFQPYLNVATGHLLGMEALVRWQHPSRGLLPPAAFFPVAEEAGLAHAIDRWVLTQACRQARRWAGRTGREVPVAVNISPGEVRRSDPRPARGRGRGLAEPDCRPIA
ncbi:MAG TPA: diguanylate cyclase [Mycobacteriales bacterium]|nr:diguanylate cyclase [Mycobacteriales bacterium]